MVNVIVTRCGCMRVRIPVIFAYFVDKLDTGSRRVTV